VFSVKFLVGARYLLAVYASRW